jgi:uncharacterized membrane protein
MNRSAIAPRLLMLLALIGLTVAFYDSYVIYKGQLLWCPPPINGCNEVAASPYARILDPPVGYYGVVYYLYMLGLPALLAYDPSSRGRTLGRFSLLPWTWRSRCTSWCCRSVTSRRSASTASCRR